MTDTKTDFVVMDLSGETTLENMIKDPVRAAEIKALKFGDPFAYAKALKEYFRNAYRAGK